MMTMTTPDVPLSRADALDLAELMLGQVRLVRLAFSAGQRGQLIALAWKEGGLAEDADALEDAALDLIRRLGGGTSAGTARNPRAAR